MTKLYTKFTWIDEVLAAAARYDILENGGGAFKSNMQINLATTVTQAGSSMTASRMNNIETAIDGLDSFLHASATEKTVSGGVLTLDQSRHKIQPETGTADDIDTISGMSQDTFAILYASDPGTDTLTLKHNTGNIRCASGQDIQLSHGFVFAFYDGSIVMIAGGGGGGGTWGSITGTLSDQTDLQTALNAKNFWKVVPGTPTRVNDTSFTITGDYTTLLTLGMPLKWTSSGTKTAIVNVSSYSAGTGLTTVSIVGDVLAAGFTSMKYSTSKAKLYTFAVAGTIGATGTDVANKIRLPYKIHPYCVTAWLGTAGNGTTTINIRKGYTGSWTSLFVTATKPSITTTNEYVQMVVVDSSTYIQENLNLIMDIDAVAATPGVDLYAQLYYIPYDDLAVD